MLTKLDYIVSQNLIQEALKLVDSSNFRLTINEPTGSFFYDKWKIKNEYQDTVWDKILRTLPDSIGEARIIVLQPGTCYQSHADIDDRYHLNIQAEQSYIINLEDSNLFKITSDGFWYEMDAGKIHTAANFGRYLRIQLVVRKLLLKNQLINPLQIKIFSVDHEVDDARFLFDNALSNWLNYANKNRILDDFKFTGNEIFFKLESSYLDELKGKMINGFKLDVLL